MLSPKISICIPTYNGAAFLQETLDSVLEQDMRDIEVVISDDSSSDGTLSMVKAFKEKAPFSVSIHHHEPAGIGANWNNAISKAQGTYIKLLFQDDIMRPTCLHLMGDFLDAHPSYGLVSSKREFIIEDEMRGVEVDKWLAMYSDLQQEYKGPHEPFLHMDKSIFGSKTFFASPLNKVGEPTVYMFRRETYNRIGPFREDLKQILDYEFCYRLLKVADIAILPQTLIAFRLHSNQATTVNLSEDIPDAGLYERLLFDEYRQWLHPVFRKKLDKKFHPRYQFKYRLVGKLRAIRKKWSA